MAIPPERSRPLHNFTLPRVKWANQRFLRCMKFNPNNIAETSTLDRRSSASGSELIQRRSSNSTQPFHKSPLNPIAQETVRPPDSDNDGIEAVREKLLLDLRVAADRMKLPILDDKKEREFEESNSSRPWNLRTRRAACKAPNKSSGGGGGAKTLNSNASSPVKPESPLKTAKSSRLRGLASAAAGATAAKQSVEKEEKSQFPKFSVSLTRQEIESDFLAMTGTKPPRRPKKRPKAVQRQLDTLSPGLWLTEITPETYEVPQVPESGKG